MPRGRPRKKPVEQLELFEDVNKELREEAEAVATAEAPEALVKSLKGVIKEESAQFTPSKFWDVYKPEEWHYVVKRNTHPTQIIRVLTHQSAQQYFKDSTQTSRLVQTCEQVDKLIGGINFDQYEAFGARLFQEAKTPEGLIVGVKSNVLRSIQPLYSGLKAISLSITEDSNRGNIVSLVITVACSDGTYESQINLVK